MKRTQADASANGKRSDARDVFQLIGRAVDEGVEQAQIGGVSVSSWVDPQLHVPREIDEQHVLDTVGKLIAVALAGTPSRAISIRAEADGDLVKVSASASGDRTWAVSLTAPPARRKVLVIDDDPVACVELAGALSDAGFSCRTATGAETALHALYAGGPWAAVLIELYLETGDALELAGIAEAPVFAMSVPDRTVSAWALRQAGFHGLLSKPVSMDKLKAAIAA